MNKTFDVIVVATMSAGKSTVINALIGKELLHSANEATTATITRIQDKDHLVSFLGSAYGYQGELLGENHQIDAQTLKEWNADPKVKTIDLAGNIKALYNDKAELVIYDTPGPNNSQDDNHEALTMEVINDGNYGLILYVLNATQLGVNDDLHLLERIAKALKTDNKKEIIFLLNKADTLDPEKGESVSSVVKNAVNYLESVSFVSPIIIPTAANHALIAGKVLNGEKLTRSQRLELKNALSSANKQMILHSTVPNDVKVRIFELLNVSQAKKRIKVAEGFNVTEQRLHRLIIRSGFGVVNHLLQYRLAK